MTILRCAAAAATLVLLGAMRIPQADAVNATEAVQTRLNVDRLDAGMAYEKPYVVLFWGAGEGHGSGQALLRMGVNRAFVKDLTAFNAP